MEGCAKLAFAKFQSARGTSHQPVFMDSSLTVGHMCFPCLPNRLINAYVLYLSSHGGASSGSFNIFQHMVSVV